MDAELLKAVEYKDGPVDIEVIMEQIRDYLARKHGRERVRPPQRAVAGRILDHDVYDELFQINHAYDQTFVAPYLTPVNIPLLGRLWQRVRGLAHALVVFYVNRAAEAQARINASVVRVLNGIVSSIDADQTPERVERLEKRVAELERQLKELAASRPAAPERLESE